MRASFLVIGPLVARFGRARVSTPGGCAIGARPIDLHLERAWKRWARPSNRLMVMSKPRRPSCAGQKCISTLPSVGATENLMMAATFAEGTTVIENAAKEPEIDDLAKALNAMGARIKARARDIIQIDGVESLAGCDPSDHSRPHRGRQFCHRRGAHRRRRFVKGARADHLEAFLDQAAKRRRSIERDDDGIRVRGTAKSKAST